MGAVIGFQFSVVVLPPTEGSGPMGL